MCRWRTSASSLESWKREISQLGDGRSLGEWRQRRPCRKARVGSLNETFGGERERGFQGKKHNNNNNNNITHRKRESWGKKTQEEEDWITNQPGFVWHSLRLFAGYKRARVFALWVFSFWKQQIFIEPAASATNNASVGRIINSTWSSGPSANKNRATKSVREDCKQQRGPLEIDKREFIFVLFGRVSDVVWVAVLVQNVMCWPVQRGKQPFRLLSNSSRGRPAGKGEWR